jgi:hypothetical protein
MIVGMRRGPGTCCRISLALQRFLAFTGGLGDELAHLLFYFGGVALGAGDLSGLVFLDTHDAHKLFAAFDANIFIGGHGISPELRSNLLFLE